MTGKKISSYISRKADNGSLFKNEGTITIDIGTISILHVWLYEGSEVLRAGQGHISRPWMGSILKDYLKGKHENQVYYVNDETQQAQYKAF